jgi:uncharacterized RDD family membrane protein YckC
MKTRNYFIVENGKSIGPLSFEDVKLKGIKKETLIWYEGLQKWKRADSIEELKELLLFPPPIDEIENENSNTPPIPPSDNHLKKNNLNNYEIASIGERFGGYILLSVIYLIIFFLAGGTADELESNDGFFKEMLISGIVGGIINGLFYPFFSGNLGHKLLGLKVIKLDDGSSVNNFFKGFSREFIKGAGSFIIIPIIWLLFNDKRQNLYDLIENTIVVRNKK